MVSPRGACTADPGSCTPICHVMNAAMPALPSTEPTCRVALYTPEPAPARSPARLRVAVAASGDQMNAMPTPIRICGSTSRQIGVVGVISIDSQVRPMAMAEKPKPMTGIGWVRSTIRPTSGASTPLAIAVGAVSRADRIGDSPHTDCA